LYPSRLLRPAKEIADEHGQASTASGVSAEMIRYYEQTGLVPAADRKDSGYRDYSQIDVDLKSA